ncbi:MICOS complex subunit mic19 [Neolecta irregularis DAH-3]|uniref:MICOS complex subunit mic19 n=1 Tax=Neolecta irregularis (strain DAH-3) TaxID=1198029 RepID=A0A1U7LVR6_NEOID|nr:MICOS complex subunit mic19 [Neolecta irregularis DAH-3]|eukprot:OLL26770.1 MICOS complex subunit mic19 [Neolecta irregularis DAH-3]
MGNSQSASSQPYVVQNPRSYPIGLSSVLVEHLDSKKADISRGITLESHIQSRVHAELKRLELLESEAFERQASELSKINIENDSGLNSTILSNDIANLKKKLEKRPKLRELDGVNQVRENLVGCLKLHEHRPLECWKEVEDFKYGQIIFE